MLPNISLELEPALGYAFAVHVMTDNEDAGELPYLFQNVAAYCKNVSYEYLFARFAWTLFPLLRNFLTSLRHRNLAVITHANQEDQGNNINSMHFYTA